MIVGNYLGVKQMVQYGHNMHNEQGGAKLTLVDGGMNLPTTFLYKRIPLWIGLISMDNC